MNIGRKKINVTGLLFILPAIIVVGGLLLYPIASSVYFSFTTKHLIKPTYKFVGLDNYISVLSDSAFLHSFMISLMWTTASLVGQILIGFTAALALNRIQKLSGFYRTLLIIPWAFPSIVIALSWKWILNGVYGFLPNLWVDLGLSNTPPEFLSGANLVFITLVLINVWFGAPLIMVNVLSALQTVPKDQYEAAQIDGASTWNSFTKITLPHIKGVVGLLVILRTIWVFNNFELIYLITGGGPSDLTTTVSIYAYNIGWGLKQLGKSSAVTVLLLLFLLVLCFIYFRIMRKWEREEA